ncbi:unnamed protein product, partial [Notodromas monacha]
MAARSPYFRALFFGGMKESLESEVVLNDPPVVAFKAILAYIYSGKLKFSDMSEESILDTLSLAHQYEFPSLEVSIAQYLQALLTVGNVCQIYDSASLYGQKKLAETCLRFMDSCADLVLKHESFLHLSQ